MDGSIGLLEFAASGSGLGRGSLALTTDPFVLLFDGTGFRLCGGRNRNHAFF
jgi:hypothetical protein